MNRHLQRLTAGLLVLSIASTAQAELVGHSSATDRERIAAFLDREDVAAQLASRGVAAAAAKARVAALTEAEAAELASRLDSVPAGGSAAGLGFAFTVVMGILFIPIALIGLAVHHIYKDATRQ